MVLKYTVNQATNNQRFITRTHNTAVATNHY